MKLGLALSGGGARGIAQIGVLKALEELEIKPDIIAGTSSGAVAGAFYAAGYSLQEMVDVVLKNKIFHFGDFAWSRHGLLKSKFVENIYNKYLNNRLLENLRIPLYVTVTNIVTCEPVYFSSGNLTKLIVASSAIPVIFEPIEYEGGLYLDGGIMDNFPIEPLLNQCDAIIGVHVNPINKNANGINVREILDRSFHLALYSRIKLKEAQCDLFIEPPMLGSYGIFDFKKANELVEIGYRYTMALREDLVKLKNKLNN